MAAPPIVVRQDAGKRYHVPCLPVASPAVPSTWSAPLSKSNNRPTLHDVARIAGVGTTTVSRVINGGDRVAPEMLTHVRKVMKELGYQPNQAARALKSARSNTIGLIIPSITDPFFASFASIAEQMAREQEYAIILLTSQDHAERGAIDLKILERHRIDGLLIVPPRTGSRALLDQLTQLAVPLVAFDRPLIGRNCSRILCDNLQAAMMATKHLVAHGRKRILVLGETHASTRFSSGSQATGR
nr:LacI family DNA-binding transcriptional regulator [Acidipila sp. EB88]